MKKMLFILMILFITVGCKQNNNLSTYNSYIEELNNINESSEEIPFDINLNIEELKNNFLRYTIIVDRKDLTMKNIEAIIIHDKETENIFPSIGIFDEKISLENSTDKKGIKLTGYLNDEKDIKFKFMIKYKSDTNRQEKYYYIYNYRQ